MHKTEPKVFLVGETRLIENGLKDYLAHVGAPEWTTDAPSDSEKLIEVYGRLCYRSFAPGLNPNVTKVREGNEKYIENILKSRHGSVTEHAMINFIFADVSRVFTHELVRHRPGTAISQESLRYVRLDELGQWLPECMASDEVAREICERWFEANEMLQLMLAEHFKLDEPGVPFSVKKEITSAMRRLAPDGLATSIGWSSNIRSLRWLLEMRTHESAEEEIRLVFGKVGKILTARYPNAFSDFAVETVKGLPYYRPEYSKI